MMVSKDAARAAGSQSRGARGMVAGLTAAMVTTWAGAAVAQPSASDRETARSLMQEARDLRDRGHTQDALKRFKAADDIMHVPTTGLEVAKTQAAMGMLVEACDTIANIRKLPSSPTDPAPFQEARNKAEDLDAQIESKIPALNITVTGAAAGETPSIVVDGIPIPAAAVGLPRKVDPGRHTIVAKGANGRGEQTVDVKEGDQKDVQITLVSASDTSAPGEVQDQSAHTDQPADNGPPKSHTPDLITWIGAGVGGAGLVAGSITGLMSISLVGQLKSNCPMMQCVGNTSGGNDYASASSLATLSDVFFVVAGVGAGVAVASLILGHPEAEAAPKQPDNGAAPAGGDSDTPADPSAAPAGSQSRLQVVPWLGLGSAGVAGVF
jgi:hypothetical protein